MKTITCLPPFSHILILLLTIPRFSCLAVRPESNQDTASQTNFITKSCKMTLYPDLCNKTLATYAMEIERSPKQLAMIALLVTFNNTQTTSIFLSNMSRNRGLKPGEKQSVIECLEEVSDSVYELRRSIKELNHSAKGTEFQIQMDNVKTWVSAALTNDDTCMDDFTSGRKVKMLVRGLVLRVARLTSIALAFINNYAAVN